MTRWYIIGPFNDDESSSHPNPPWPDRAIEFIILVIYLFVIYSFKIHTDSSHLQFDESYDLLDKGAVYFYHYALCVPGMAYAGVASFLYSIKLTDFSNLNLVIRICSVIIWFLFIYNLFRLIWLRLYFAILVLSGLVYFILKIIVWLFR